MTNHFYKWDSNALKRYGTGYIISAGSSLEMARNNARDRIKSYIDEKLYYLDEEDIQKIVDKFENDIAEEPLKMSVIFIDGSQ
jgi:hypothetical protein